MFAFRPVQGDPKVSKIDNMVLDENVLWFDILVSNTVLMKITQRRCETSEKCSKDRPAIL